MQCCCFLLVQAHQLELTELEDRGYQGKNEDIPLEKTTNKKMCSARIDKINVENMRYIAKNETCYKNMKRETLIKLLIKI